MIPFAMVSAEEQYRKSLAQLSTHLSDIEKKRLQSLYRLPTQYNELPAEAELQALELLGVYSSSRPEGVAELPGWLGMRRLQKEIRNRLKKPKGVKLNDSFCLPLCEELYAAVDLQRYFQAVQEYTRILGAHVELLKRVTTQSGSSDYETVGGPGSLDDVSKKIEEVLQCLRAAASDYDVHDSAEQDRMGTIQHMQHHLVALSAPGSDPQRRKMIPVSASLQREVAAAVGFPPNLPSRSKSQEFEEQSRTGLVPPIHTNVRANRLCPALPPKATPSYPPMPPPKPTPQAPPIPPKPSQPHHDPTRQTAQPARGPLGYQASAALGPKKPILPPTYAGSRQSPVVQRFVKQLESQNRAIPGEHGYHKDTLHQSSNLALDLDEEYDDKQNWLGAGQTQQR